MSFGNGFDNFKADFSYVYIYVHMIYSLTKKSDHSGGEQVFGESSAVCDPAVRYFKIF